MKSIALGLSTSPAQITNISQYGFWPILGRRVFIYDWLTLSFSEFLWFRDATIGKYFARRVSIIESPLLAGTRC